MPGGWRRKLDTVVCDRVQHARGPDRVDCDTGSALDARRLRRERRRAVEPRG